MKVYSFCSIDWHVKKLNIVAVRKWIISNENKSIEIKGKKYMLWKDYQGSSASSSFYTLNIFLRKIFISTATLLKKKFIIWDDFCCAEKLIVFHKPYWRSSKTDHNLIIAIQLTLNIWRMMIEDDASSILIIGGRWWWGKRGKKLKGNNIIFSFHKNLIIDLPSGECITMFRKRNNLLLKANSNSFSISNLITQFIYYCYRWIDIK